MSEKFSLYSILGQIVLKYKNKIKEEIIMEYFEGFLLDIASFSPAEYLEKRESHLQGTGICVG